MILTSIHLKQFRNFENRAFAIHPFLTIIIGENSRGKTNLLESIFFSISGKGFREWREEELIMWDKANLSVESTWHESESKSVFSIFLTKKSTGIEKKFAVQKVQKSAIQYKEFQTNAVLFAPEHIDIVTGSPDERRSYINSILSAADREYKKRVQNYEHALRKRNKVLEFHKNEAALIEELGFWNTYLEEQAAYITQEREQYVEYLNLHNKVDHKTFAIEYLKNPFTKARLAEVFTEERRWRKTIIGPQKDDFAITIEDSVSKNVHHYGSRSEQRLAVFWLKLNELRYFEESFKKRPLLLLDDIFSELDIKNKALVLHLIKSYQTILTTTEVELLELSEMPQEIIKL